MLSDKAYARYFGQSLLEEILHLDEELTQAVTNKQDPAVEEELERSLDVALSEADVVARDILEEVTRKPEAHVKCEYEKELDTMMEAELGETKPKVDWDRARKSADEFLSGKRKGIPGMRMATAKDLGLKKKDIKVNEEAPKKPKRKISDARRNRFHDFLKGKSYCTNCREHGHSTDDCKATCPDCHGQGRFSRRGCSTCGDYAEPDE